jgi:hypothetical protein
MPKFKAARGKKKPKPSKAGAVGCFLAIALLLAFFIWAFSVAIRPG